TATMRDVFNAKNIVLIGNNPTDQHPLLAWQIRNNVRLHKAKLYVVNSQAIKLQRQSVAFAQVPSGSESFAAAFLAGNDSVGESVGGDARNALLAMRQQLKGAEDAVVIFGSEIRAAQVKAVVNLAIALNAKIACLGDYANSRGAADMGLYPDMLPGYHPATASSHFREEWAGIPQQAGLDLPGMVEAAKAGKLKALYVVGSNPVGRLDIDPF